jgi:hypothetical protein
LVRVPSFLHKKISISGIGFDLTYPPAYVYSAPPITVLPVSPPPALPPSSPDSSDPNRKTESENAIPGAGEGSGSSNNPWLPAADAPKGQISISSSDKKSPPGQASGEGGRVPKRDSPADVPSLLDKRILDTEDMLGEEDRQVDTEDAVKGFVDSLLRDGGLWMTTFEVSTTINLYY